MKLTKRILIKLLNKKFFDFLPEEKYISFRYKVYTGEKLDLKNPQTLNEKLQWIKLYDRDPLYTQMVDKYAVREYITEKIGDEYLIPLLGVWDNAVDIDFDSLPKQFVLKCNHDSGSIIVCRDKSKLDIEKAKQKLNYGMKRDFYSVTREWPYKNVKRKIIAERYMEDSASPELRDYKFFCFEGNPEFLYLSEGLENHNTAKISYVSLDWETTPFQRSDYPQFKTLPDKPKNFDKMIELAARLSNGIHFLRVDFYEINGRIYFGELTFFPGSGYTRFLPEEWEKKLGEKIKL